MKKAFTISILAIFSVLGCLDPELEADDMDLLIQGAEIGLKGQYFNNIDLTSPALERVDSSIDFDWGNGSPHSKIDPDTFSVRWTGFVTAKYSQTYTFYTIGDDGIRLYVDNKLVVNDWSNHGARERSGTIALKAGQSYPIKLEYYENKGGAVAKLLWSSQSQAKQIIPAAQLKTELADITVNAQFKNFTKLSRTKGTLTKFNNVDSKYLIYVESWGRNGHNNISMTQNKNKCPEIDGAVLQNVGGGQDKFIALYKVNNSTVTVHSTGGSAQVLFIKTANTINLTAKSVDPAIGAERIKGPKSKNQIVIYAEDEGGKSNRDAFFMPKAIDYYGSGDDLLYLFGYGDLSPTNNEGPNGNGAVGTLTFL